MSKKLFALSVGLFSLLSLFMVWGVHYPPMQDYPTHLMLAKILATNFSQEFDWQKYFAVDYSLRPYSLSYLIIAKLSSYVDIEVAGKILLSIYLLLIVHFIVAQAKTKFTEGYVPWMLLLCFPFAFSQVYYHGFVNYLISLPVLLWLLVDLGGYQQKEHGWWSVFRQLTFPAVLFLLHPYTLLVYIALALSSCGMQIIRGRGFGRKCLIPIGWFVGFLIWYLINHDLFGTRSPGINYLYIDVIGEIIYLLMPLVGHQLTPHIGVLTFLSWIAVLYMIWRSSYVPGKTDYALYLVLMLVFVMVTPFTVQNYAYFNLRLAVPMYFVLVLYFSDVRLDKRYIMMFILSVMAMYVDIYNIHVGVSREVDELNPLFAKMHANATILPLYGDKSSQVIDDGIYYEMHVHTHDYYHVKIGGGANSMLFYNEMLPVKYREGISLPVVNVNDDVQENLRNAFGYYDYLLLRGELKGIPPSPWEHIADSGRWHLYKSIKMSSTVDN